jgi:hypothetical protein
MRAAVLVVATGCAVAEVPPIELADIARVLYLNDCKPQGCTVLPGDDDARSDRSSMVQRQTLLAPFAHAEHQWVRLVECVRDMYAPFDLAITTSDPGREPHFELMIAGHPAAIGLETAGGAALSTCPHHVLDNALGFVFASYLTPDMLCWAAAQESGHMLGLDHTILRLDPMTWLSPPLIKAAFQDVDAECGEYEARPCNCHLARQNTHEVLMATLGPNPRIL